MFGAEDDGENLRATEGQKLNMPTLQASLELVLLRDQPMRAICEADLTSLLILRHGLRVEEFVFVHVGNRVGLLREESFADVSPLGGGEGSIWSA